MPFGVVGMIAGRRAAVTWHENAADVRLAALEGDPLVKVRAGTLIAGKEELAASPTGPFIEAGETPLWAFLLSVMSAFDAVEHVEGDVAIPWPDVPAGATP